MNFDLLIQKIETTHNALFSSAAKAVNIALTLRNWLFGYYIVEFEQDGVDRAKYGENLLNELSEKLGKDIKGISPTNLRLFRQFYLTYPEIGAVIPDFVSNYLSAGNYQTPSAKLPPEAGTQIHQTLSDESNLIDITTIQVTSKAKATNKKIGLDPARIL
jgi:hypothetical protein